MLPPMGIPYSIDCGTGIIRIGNDIVLEPGQAKAVIVPRIADLLRASRDHGNGYEWLTLSGLAFGGQAATLALGFHDGRFEQASWSVELPGEAEGDGPTRAMIDDEVSFVRHVLINQMGIRPGDMPWGKVWSQFDARGFLASHGFRYR